MRHRHRAEAMEDGADVKVMQLQARDTKAGPQPPAAARGALPGASRGSDLADTMSSDFGLQNRVRINFCWLKPSGLQCSVTQPWTLIHSGRCGIGLRVC